MTAGEGDLVGLPTCMVHDEESLMAHGAPEALVPMMVDPMAGLPLPEDLELVSRPCSGSSWGVGHWLAAFGCCA